MLLYEGFGALKYFLGIVVAHSQEVSFSTNSQQKYALDILTEAGMLGCKLTNTPMEQNRSLTHTSGESFAHTDQYRRLVGRLIYLSVTLLELSYSVHALAQVLSDPQVTRLFLRRLRNNLLSLVPRPKPNIVPWQLHTCELKWLKALLFFLGVSCTKSMQLFVIVSRPWHIAKNPVFHDRTKHIEVDCQLVRDELLKGNISTSYVLTHHE
ncbi:uncharacterized protein LOC110727638 [Chenopodium quinoa]|uniref:uncharacterized protein LOC110727638 n=1 Tax=Chenopodium quinoa TaxID=63459 RepID=UPI000B77273F|nr:uncharacterized protein LOC110727638 [Chenopodium quinoa]